MGGKIELFIILSILIFVFIILPAIIWIYFDYKSRSFIVESNRITINSGILIKRSKLIPFDKIQNIENFKGLLLRICGISKLYIWTASPQQIQISRKKTSYRSDGILVLDVDDSEWLKNFILNKPS